MDRERVVQEKDTLVQRYIQILNVKNLTLTEISFFLGGNIYQQLDLKMEVGMCSEILMSLKMITESVINGVLTKTNLAQILVESLVQTKKNNSRHNLLKEFRKSMQVNWNEVAINRKYLRDKWIVQKKNERYYAQLMREEEENRKREEDETMRYIKRMEEEQNIERMKKEEMNEVLLKQFMQNDEKQKVKKRKQLENKKQTCDICLEDIEYIDLQTLQCKHSFHRHCIAQHIKASLNQKKVQIKCPAGCGELIPVAIIEECTDGNTRQKFYQFSLDHFVQKNHQNTSWCPSPGCTSVFTYEGDLDNYKCMVCKKHYCLSCRCNYHYGMTCAEYRVSNSYGEDDKKFQEFVKGAKFKQCPKCNYWVQRVDGCSTMRCRCGNEFCYDCGGSDCPHGACKNKGKKR